MEDKTECVECGHPKSEHRNGDCDLCGYLFARPPKHEFSPTQDTPTFAWVVEGRVRAGTLTDYAEDRQMAEPAGLSVSEMLWDGTRTVPAKIAVEPIESDLIWYRIDCAGQTARYSIDARS